MSRVRKPNNKYMNTNKYSSSVTAPSKMTHIKGPDADYTKASFLTDWLYLKYDMSYKTYRNKSRNRRLELKGEFLLDTTWSFEKYCEKYGKTIEEIKKESEIIQCAWHEEYETWLSEELDKYYLDNKSQAEKDYDEAMQTLADCGVPFAPDGTPLGI